MESASPSASLSLSSRLVVEIRTSPSVISNASSVATGASFSAMTSIVTEAVEVRPRSSAIV